MTTGATHAALSAQDPDPTFERARGTPYLDFLRAMHVTQAPRQYLEIGTNRGESLALADCASIAIDPKFLIGKNVMGQKPRLDLLQTTSDDAFESGAVAAFGVEIDLAFLDGLHVFEALLRDFINVERHMRAGGLVFMHDTRPFSHQMTARVPPGGAWTGDVWKLLPILQEYRSDLELVHLDCRPTGLLLVRGDWLTSDALEAAYQEIVERFINVELADFGVAKFQDAFPLRAPEEVFPEIAPWLAEWTATPAPPKPRRAEAPAVTRVDGIEIPVMQTFEDVTVMPTRKLGRYKFYGDGGPIWPDRPDAKLARHNRDGRPIPLTPTAPDAPPARAAGDFVWGGFAQPHFGHLVSEHLTRLPVSLIHRPSDTYLFTRHPKYGAGSPPDFFFELCEWYGLPRAQVHLVDAPMRVERLHVAPQAEQMTNVAPAPYALDLMERIARRNALQSRPDGVVYVSRVGMLGRHKGGHAGESYLVQRLAAQGVTVLDPAEAPLRTQLETYAGARTLVFAEGSAQHGRQLLGHRPQSIFVLKRRMGHSVASAALAPRCDKVEYVSATREVIAPFASDGNPILVIGISLYDIETVFGFFDGLGIDLRSGWDQAAFERSVHEDMAIWYRTCLEEKGRDWVTARCVEARARMIELGFRDAIPADDSRFGRLVRRFKGST